MLTYWKDPVSPLRWFPNEYVIAIYVYILYMNCWNLMVPANGKEWRLCSSERVNNWCIFWQWKATTPMETLLGSPNCLFTRIFWIWNQRSLEGVYCWRTILFRHLSKRGERKGMGYPSHLPPQSVDKRGAIQKGWHLFRFWNAQCYGMLWGPFVA